MRTILKSFGIITACGIAWSAHAGDKPSPETVALWDKDCASCHAKDGKGDTKMGKKLGAKDYTDPTVQEKLKDEAASKAIQGDLKDKDDKTLMKPSKDLTHAQVKAVLAYLRTFKKP